LTCCQLPSDQLQIPVVPAERSNITAPRVSALKTAVQTSTTVVAGWACHERNKKLFIFTLSDDLKTKFAFGSGRMQRHLNSWPGPSCMCPGALHPTVTGSFKT